jgi:hypothetical protein
MLKQTYLINASVVVAYVFTWIPEWTTWTLLVAMAVYDVGAVLAPGGPLRLLIELAEERDEDIPALVYQARSVRILNSGLETCFVFQLWMSGVSGVSHLCRPRLQKNPAGQCYSLVGAEEVDIGETRHNEGEMGFIAIMSNQMRCII